MLCFDRDPALMMSEKLEERRGGMKTDE